MKSWPLILCYVLTAFALSDCSVSVNQSTVPAPTSLSEGQALSWSHLNLSGRLVFLKAELAKNPSISVEILDLKSGDSTTIFQAPGNAWIFSLAVSPDTKHLVMAYLPPSGEGKVGRQRLYTMPLDGTSPPQPLFTPLNDNDEYMQPEWSPDGKSVYFSHLTYQPLTTYEVMRMKYPNGELEEIAKQAYWPRMSNDGSQLAYVSIDPDTQANQLFVANADGTNARVVPFVGSFWIHNVIIDAPMFLPDDQTLLFSAPIPLQSKAPGWFEWMFGITVASAHPSIPSDWWSVPVTGGEPTRLTHLYSPSLYASLSPDRKHIASYSVANGVFVMNIEGKELTEIVSFAGGIPGTVSWIP